MAAAACAAALLVALGPRRAPAVARLEKAGEGPDLSRRPRGWLLVPVALVVVTTAALLGGATAGTLAAAAAAIAGTGASQLRSQARERERRRAEAQTARACALVAAEVRSGRSPENAVEVVAQDCPVLLPAAAALAVGDDAVRVWQQQSRGPGLAGLGALARAWQVSRRCGAPMGPSLDQVAGALEREAEVTRTVRGELAAAQATGRLMAVLPLVGIGLGYSIGGRPLEFLLGSTAGLACTLVATVLACTGVLWTSALARPSDGGR